MKRSLWTVREGGRENQGEVVGAAGTSEGSVGLVMVNSQKYQSASLCLILAGRAVCIKAERSRESD